jgi:hypothetical protein
MNPGAIAVDKQRRAAAAMMRPLALLQMVQAFVALCRRLSVLMG